MRVHEVQLPLARDAHDRVGQREQVLRLAEKRIRGRFDTLERQAWQAMPPPERDFTADEMHAMAPKRQRVGQLGSDHAAAAYRRVTDNPDVHGSDLRRPPRRTGSRTTKPSAKATPARAPNCASRLSMSCRKVEAVRRVATASPAAGANCVVKQASASRFLS